MSGGYSTALQGGPGAAGMRRPACGLMDYLNRLRALYARWIDWLELWLTPRSLREAPLVHSRGPRCVATVGSDSVELGWAMLYGSPSQKR